ncbi:MAG: type IV secretion system DNA-binding domain-containing protein [Candidatus Doudnabacteria bacterium]
MDNSSEKINVFGVTNFRNRQVPFGIKPDDRRRHMYVIGKTGMGKTTLLENMAIQDIRNGHGVCFIDPHGDSVSKILDFVPPHRINDVIYFNPADLEHPIAFNILESVESRYKHLVASGLMGVFTKIWANMWSSRMEYILNNTILALLDSPGNTMLGVVRMYVDKKYRKKIIDNIKDPMVKAFWIEEFANYNERYRTEAVAPIQNKVGQFLSSGVIRNIVGQTKSTLDLREVMDNQKILLLDLSKGKVGEDNSALLGAMIITKLQLAALSRVDIPEHERKDFFLYVDEFQNFVTDSFATILSEARKYRLNLIMGHQYIGQLTPENNTRVRDAVFGNVGTMVVFRVGASDAEYLETEFEPSFTPTDIVNLPKYHVVLKLMINGVASDPFTAKTIPVNDDWIVGDREKVIKVSRERYAKPREQVEDKIQRWMGTDFHEAAAHSASGDKMDDEINTRNGRPSSNKSADPKPQTSKLGQKTVLKQSSDSKPGVKLSEHLINKFKDKSKEPKSSEVVTNQTPKREPKKDFGNQKSKPKTKTFSNKPINKKGKEKNTIWDTAQNLSDANISQTADQISKVLQSGLDSSKVANKNHNNLSSSTQENKTDQQSNGDNQMQEGRTYDL